MNKYQLFFIICIVQSAIGMEEKNKKQNATEILKQENSYLKNELNKYKDNYYNMTVYAGVAWTIIAIESFRQWYQKTH
jgi:hypothetical protein